MSKVVVLYEVNLSARYRNGSRLERVLKTSKKHPWSHKTLYALYRSSGRPIVLFVPSTAQLAKIKKRSGTIRITSRQTESGIGEFGAM
jgi:hypothetical protein